MVLRWNELEISQGRGEAGIPGEVRRESDTHQRGDGEDPNV